jgi:outer membrane protein with beta-barrel domain
MRTAYRALVFMSVLAGAAPASAQDADHSFSVGGSISGLGLFNETGRPKTSPGTGAWLTAHLLGPLALEGRVAWFPTKEPVQLESQGGRTLKVTAGARGTLVASRRMRLYGILQPGIIRFSNTASGDADGHTTAGPKTHFAIDTGGAVELFPQSRWTARFDFVQTLFVVPGAVLTPPAPCCEPSLTAESKGEIAETFQVSAGVGYRLGTRRPVSTGSTVTPSIGRLNIGGQFAYAITSTFGELSPFHDAGVGAFLSYRLSRHVFADGALSAFTREAEVRSPWEGVVSCKDLLESRSDSERRASGSSSRPERVSTAIRKRSTRGITRLAHSPSLAPMGPLSIWAVLWRWIRARGFVCDSRLAISRSFTVPALSPSMESWSNSHPFLDRNRTFKCLSELVGDSDRDAPCALGVPGVFVASATVGPTR